MIQLEIIDCPDKNVIGLFQFFQNQILLGQSSGNLYINDSELLVSHFMIEVVEKDLIVHPQKNVESYLIDGKRSSTVRKIKSGQVIKIGKTSFKVVSFDETNRTSKKKILDGKLSKMVEMDSPRLKVIEKLAQMMK